MPAAAISSRKPRLKYALQLVRNTLNDGDRLTEFLNNGIPGNHELQFLRSFLSAYGVQHALELMDHLMSPSSQQKRSPQSIIANLRPDAADQCDSLRVLSDVWSELEQFVMRTKESDQPDAHELYDLLADPYLRELLVAYDDIANLRYVSEINDLIPVYSELSTDKIVSQSHIEDSIGAAQAVVNGSEATQSLQNDSLNEVSPLSEDSVNLRLPNNFDPSIPTQQPPPCDGPTNNRGGVSNLIHRFETVQTDEPLRRKSSSSKTQEMVQMLQAKPETPTPKPDDETLDTVTQPTVIYGKPVNPTSTGNQRQSIRLDSNTVHPPPSSPPTSMPTSHSRQSRNHHLSLSPPANPLSPSSPKPVKQRKDVYPNSSIPEQHHRGGSHRESHTSKSPPDSRGERSRRRVGDQPRLVRLRRDRAGESIGITVALHTSSTDDERSPPVITIQRVLAGSLAARGGSLFPGDVLLEVNGHHVRSLDEVHRLMLQTASSLECELLVKAAPTNKDAFLRPGPQHKVNGSKRNKRYIRTFFDYNAERDALLPAGVADVGLSFKAGDVIELVDDQDPNWWQVRTLHDPDGEARLVPSQTLEERRKAFNQEKTPTKTAKKSKGKSKTFFRAAEASDLRLRADLWIYEEVVPWPKSMVPCLLLLGTTGVGRRNLKVLLSKAEPDRFAFPISDTTNPSAASGQFHILTKSQMESDIRSGAYVEWGVVDGHHYGLRFGAIRKIIASGRTAILDCQPQTVHLLHQPEFNPCAVFVGAPPFDQAKQMMEEGLRAGVTSNNHSDAELHKIIEDSTQFATVYRHLYFHSIINVNINETVRKLSRLITRLENQPSWIPCGWAYELSVPRASKANAPFLPGSSSLSALGIHNLPPARATSISRSVLSGISEASTESAQRMARPPSILSSTQSNQPDGGRSKRLPDQSQGKSTGNGRLYERRRKPYHGYDTKPYPPAIPEVDTPSTSHTGHPRIPDAPPPSTSNTRPLRGSRDRESIISDDLSYDGHVKSQPSYRTSGKQQNTNIVVGETSDISDTSSGEELNFEV